MVKENLGFFDYLKAAFNLKVKILSLGYLPLNKLMLVGFLILGFGNVGFWFLGFAYEIGYILILTGNERFQKLVQGDELQRDKERWTEKQNKLLLGLDRPSQERYQRLARSCIGILQSADGSTNAIQIEGLRTGELNQLLWIFLRLLNSRKKTGQILAQTSRDALEKEIKDISDKLTKESDKSAVYRTLQGTLDIQKRRLENLLKAEENYRVTEAELDRIEKQVTLIMEETTVSTDPEFLTVRLDNVMTSLQGTTQWMSEHGEFFGMSEDEVAPANLLPAPIKSSEKE